MDPVPLVVGIYAYVGELLARTAERREGDDAVALGRRLTRQKGQADGDTKKLVRALHTDVKVADKLLKKTADVWKISQETDLVDLVILGRGEEPQPRAYVLLLPRELKALLQSIRAAAQGAGENQEVIRQVEDAAEQMGKRANEYTTFGFDPWKG
ncbi:MAG: hypothetical protein ACRENP_01530 [Longimicrobiales bacterium]